MADESKKPTFLPADEPEKINTVNPSLSNPQIDEVYTTAALDWAVSSAQDFKCPVCGNAFTLGGDDAGNAKTLKAHLQSQHFARVLVGYAQRDLDAVYKIARDEAEADEGLFEDIGIDIDAESGDHYNSLEIDPDIEKKLTADGSRLYWAHPRNLIRYKRRGMEVVPGVGVNGAHVGAVNQVNSQELVLMKIPIRLVEVRDRIKQRAIDNGVDARAEDRMNRVTDIQRRAHDTMARRGASPDQIRNVVSAVGKGLETGLLRIKDAKGNRQQKMF